MLEFFYLEFLGPYLAYGIGRKCILASMIKAGCLQIIFGEMLMVVIAKNEFLHEMKRDGMRN